MRQIKGKTLQEHIWNSMEEIPEYSTWHWVELINHFKLPIKHKEFNKWSKEQAAEGIDYFEVTQKKPNAQKGERVN